MSKFPARLRALRSEHSLSQQNLADQLGCVSKSSINMYERGEREPGLETLEAIADYFNVDMDYLLGKSDIPNRYSWLRSIGINEQSNIVPDQSNVPDNRNVIRIAGRNGSYIVKHVTDEQLQAFKTMLDALPDIDDDLL